MPGELGLPFPGAAGFTRALPETESTHPETHPAGERAWDWEVTAGARAAGLPGCVCHPRRSVAIRGNVNTSLKGLP